MSLERPTIRELIKRMEDDAQSRLSVPQLRRSNAKVYIRTLAGAIHGLYGHLHFLHKQQFFDTAEAEYLDRWASIYDVRRKQATKASGSVRFSFSGAPVNIPIGTVLQSDGGIQYQTTGAVDADTFEAEAEALEPGISGNQSAGDELQLVSPVAGVFSEVTIVGMAGGANAESDDSLRSRLLNRVQETPHGGTAADYVRWALEVPGVTRAWSYPLEDGPGTVTVRFVCDGTEEIIPDEEMMQRVQDHLDELRPVTALVTVGVVTLKPVDITIESLLPDSTAVRQAVTDELRDLFTREAYPGGRVFLSHIRAAVSAAVGEEDHSVTSPESDPVAQANELLTLGEITWQ